MKIASYATNDEIRTGIIVDDLLFDTGFDGSMIDLIERWGDVKPQIESKIAGGNGIPLESVKLCAPVQRPGKIFAIGLNYADHIEESGMETPERQVWFTKAQTSINGPFDPILITRGTQTNDYEAELVVVIGKRAKHVRAQDAANYVFGYCVGNDVTERLTQHATPQWSLGKSFDTHAPIGPWITTPDEVGDPHQLGIRCFVNGEKRQDSNTKHLVFDIWQQIEHLSSAMTLEPGDIIFTGTPGGIGAVMDPRRFLQAGDIVSVEIDRLGEISAEMKDEPS